MRNHNEYSSIAMLVDELSIYPQISPIIITGMHRSGTSLIANFFGANELQLGSNLMQQGKGNPLGHFEDWEFVDFHNDVLKENNFYIYFRTQPKIKIRNHHISNALTLIQNKSLYEFWGWKDPRTILFLNLWQSILPDARYIFVYRDFSMVVKSLLSREEFPGFLLRYPHFAATSTIIYNSIALQFYKAHRQKCILAKLEHILADPQKFADIVNQKLELNLSASAFEKIYVPELLDGKHKHEWLSNIINLLFQCKFGKLSQQMDSMADL